MPIDPRNIADPNATFRITADDLTPAESALAASQGSPVRAAAPGTQSTADRPESILEQHLQGLQDSFREREGNLKAFGLKENEHNFHVQKLQREYDDRKFEMMQTRGALDVIQRAMAAGQMDETAGNQAMYSLVLPREAVQAMFPKPQQTGVARRPFTQRYLKEVQDQFKEAAKEAPTTPSYLPRRFEDVPQEGLIEVYLQQRAFQGYDALPPIEQKQYDAAIDSAARDDRNLQWDPSSTDIKSLRTYGNRLLGSLARKISPFARSIAKTKRVPSLHDKFRRTPAAPEPQGTAGEIRVRDKASGQSGWLPANEFNPNQYERI